MPSSILDLRNVKCPMNLVFIKNAVHENSLQTGSKIIIEDLTAKHNIAKYLTLKQIKHTSEGNTITIL